MMSIDDYRRKVLERHRPAFDLWREVSATYQAAMATPRNRPTDLHIVLDMQMVQAGNAHAAVALVAQHGLLEDAATITRRLLELSVQAVYIAADDDPRTRDRRAGSYIAFLWRRLPRRTKLMIPAPIRAEWSATARRFGRLVPRRARRWGPDWRTMFRECGVEDLYDSDYAFLSGVAHGSPEEQVLRFSMEKIRAHDDRHVSTLLVYASKYYAVAAEQWNGLFQVVPASKVGDLRDRLVKWKRTKGSKGAT